MRNLLTSLRRVPRWTALFLVMFAIGWLASLEHRGLFIPDEGRYAEIPREMVATGDWVTPRLNDLKYFEKPPMQYWLTAASFVAFGEDEWTARLPVALLGLIGLAMLLLTCSRLHGPRAALLATAMLGSTWGYYLAGQYLTLDMSLTAFLGIAMCAFLLAQSETSHPGMQRRWMALAWVGVACGLLSKGLIALILPALSLAAYSVVARDKAIWRRLHLMDGVVVLAVLALPWFVLVQQRNPEFFSFFFIREHFERFLQPGHSRPGAWWYYLPILILALTPWAPVVLARARQLLSTRALSPSHSGRSLNVPLFCVIWTAVTVLFFSVSQSKLPAYILPTLPALAIFCAGLPRAHLPKALRQSGISLLLLGLVLLVALPVIPASQKFQRIGATALFAMPWLYLGAAVLIGGGAVAWQWSRHCRATILGLSVTTFLFWGLMFGFLHQTDAAFSSERMIERLTNDTKPFRPGIAFYSVGQFDHSLPFYLGRPVTLVATRGELGLGIDSEPQKVIERIEDFQRRWLHEANQAYASMTPDQYRRFLDDGLPMVKVQADRRLVVVSRHHAHTTDLAAADLIPPL